MSEVNATPTEMVVVTAANLRGLTDTLYPVNQETLHEDISKELTKLEGYISASKFSESTKTQLRETMNKMVETLRLGLSETTRKALYEYSRNLISTSV
jgi:hypothetical protein